MFKKIILILSLSFVGQSFAACDNNQQRERILTKIGYGPTHSSMKHLEKYCHYDDWLESQMKNVNLFSDKEIEKTFSELETTKSTEVELFRKYDVSPAPNQDAIAFELVNKRFKYAIYSENRLREMMVWFWFNHFNVNGEVDVYMYIDSYLKMFRENSFNNFEDILRNVLHHPAMLSYLNNSLNKKVGMWHNLKLGLNENYARELLELHTMGVHSGYTQKDIQELAKILTGLTSPVQNTLTNMGENQKEFNKVKSFADYKHFIESKKMNLNIFDSYSYFENDYHVDGDKEFLGKTIKSNKDLEIEEVLHIIANHPKTAEFISKKIALFFLGEDGEKETLENMNSEFLKTNGNIHKVLSVLFSSEQFNRNITKTTTFKNPYEYVISTLKTTLDGKMVNNFNYVIFILNKMSFGLHTKITPEGYSLRGDYYLTSSVLQEYIIFINQLNQHIKENININENYFKLNEKEYMLFLISKDWLYK